jgi:predicted Zn-ribbon and HTH transcriptional regulator
MDDDKQWRQAIEGASSDADRSEHGLTGGTGPDDDDYIRIASEQAKDSRAVSPSQCSTCGTAIPPNREKCSSHEVNTGSEGGKASDMYDREQVHVLVTVVEANNRYHALSLGGATHNVVADRVDGIDETELIYDCDEKQIAASIDIFGAKLPDVLKLSDDSDNIVQQAIEQSDGQYPSVVDEVVDHYESMAEVEQKQTNADSELWIVPGVCTSVTLELEDEVVRYRDCPRCGETTDHVHEYTKSRRQDNENAFWKCLECDKSHWGVPPADTTGRIPDPSSIEE